MPLTAWVGNFVSRDGDSITINMPRWRFDILHPVDLVEDIAIGHGYEDLGKDIPRSPMTAKLRDDANLLRRVRDSMQGLGMMQIQSLFCQMMMTNLIWLG